MVEVDPLAVHEAIHTIVIQHIMRMVSEGPRTIGPALPCSSRKPAVISKY